MSASIPENFRELQLLVAQNPSNRISFQWLFATTQGQRVSCVEAAIDWVSQELTKTRQHRQKSGEDGLTADIILALKAMGFDASHDKAYGGHGDIVIEARDNFLWIGEAKVHSSYEWLLKGFEQLDTRYSTGLEGQEHGGLIIYCMGPRADEIMAKWVEHLSTARPDVKIDDIIEKNHVRRSEHKHAATGRVFKVRHVPISLYFAPQDRKAKAKAKAPKSVSKVGRQRRGKAA